MIVATATYFVQFKSGGFTGIMSGQAFCDMVARSSYSQSDFYVERLSK